MQNTSPPTPSEAAARAAAASPIPPYRALAAALGAALASHLETGMLHRVEVPAPAFDPLGWLASQGQSTQYYWSSRDSAWEMAGIGEAEVLSPLGTTDLRALFAHMRRQLPPEIAGLRYYGGFRFHGGPVRGARWQMFKDYRFVVPQFEVVRRRKGTFLACNFKTPPAERRHALLEQLLAGVNQLADGREAPPPATLPGVRGRVDVPNAQEWYRQVDFALEAFAADHLQKVVMARETTFQLDGAVDPVQLLRRLLPITQQCYEFCFHPAADRAFIGTSPERLYRRVNVHLESEALAGTRRRGKTDQEDAALAEELRDSQKEMREHRFVVRTLHEVFDRYCRSIRVDDGPSILRLRNVQHLYTHIEGILEDAEVDAALIDALHPTPAVGGTPRNRALAWIESHEPFDRGIYAAPVGWVGYDAAEFCVAIRSALVQGDEISVYTGAGIVPGSTAEAEWQEIEAKMSTFLEVLQP